jgi:hypothetical protein
MDVIRLRGTHRLDPAELQTHVFRLLRDEPALASYDERALRVAMAVLLNQGVGLRATPGAGEGYRQILSLYAGALLKLAGAGLEAIESEVERRDEARLEVLIRSVLSRLAQAAEAGSPDAQSDAIQSRAGSAEAESQAVPVASFANIASPFYRRRGGADEAPTPESPALAFLRERLTSERLSMVRGPAATTPPARRLNVGRLDNDSRSAVAVRPAPSQGAVRLELADGVTLTLTDEAVIRHRPAAARAALIRSLAAALTQLEEADR